MTSTVQDEMQRLRERLEALEVERGQIQYAMAVLKRIEPTPLEATLQRRMTMLARRAGRAGTAPEVAIGIIAESGRSWNVEDLVSAMQDRGWTSPSGRAVETVRSALSRAVADGRVVRTAPGLYGPVPSDEAPLPEPTADPDGQPGAEDASTDVPQLVSLA